MKTSDPTDLQIANENLQIRINRNGYAFDILYNTKNENILHTHETTTIIQVAKSNIVGTYIKLYN